MPVTCTGADAAREAQQQQAGASGKAAPAPAPAPAATNLLGMVKSCAANVRPHLRPAMPSLEEIRSSPHYPVVVTPNPSLPGDHTYNGSNNLTAPLAINGGVIEWDNDIFQGRMVMHLRGEDGVEKGKRRPRPGNSAPHACSLPACPPPPVLSRRYSTHALAPLSRRSSTHAHALAPSPPPLPPTLALTPLQASPTATPMCLPARSATAGAVCRAASSARPSEPGTEGAWLLHTSEPALAPPRGPASHPPPPSCPHPPRVSDICIGQEIEVPARGPSEYIIQWVVTQIAHVSAGAMHGLGALKPVRAPGRAWKSPRGCVDTRGRGGTLALNMRGRRPLCRHVVAHAHCPSRAAHRPSARPAWWTCTASTPTSSTRCWPRRR
jgi:hypothetical protein